MFPAFENRPWDRVGGLRISQNLQYIDDLPPEVVERRSLLKIRKFIRATCGFSVSTWNDMQIFPNRIRNIMDDEIRSSSHRLPPKVCRYIVQKCKNSISTYHQQFPFIDDQDFVDEYNSFYVHIPDIPARFNNYGEFSPISSDSDSASESEVSSGNVVAGRVGFTSFFRDLMRMMPSSSLILRERTFMP